MSDINKILQAVAVAYRDFKNAFRPERSSDELWDSFQNSLRGSLGEYEIVYDYIWGKDTLNIDGVTKNYIPKTGDTLIMDISVGKDGVWCDVCRTFFVGTPTERQRSVFERVKQSLREGHKALKAGAKARDIYQNADTMYALNGEKLVHHAGHRIGKKPLLQPQFLADNETPIVCGELYTVETGSYEDFGIRLENDYLITEDGAEDLFEHLLPLDIEEYIL